MKAKISKLFLLLLIIVFLFSFISCKDTGAQATIAELEKKISELEKESKENPSQEQPEAETTEEIQQESTTTESSTVEIKKELSPTMAGSLYISGYTSNIYVIGDYAYIAGDGLNVIDISDKENPLIIGNTQAIGWIVDFNVDENYAYLPYGTWDNEGNPSGGGFQIVDIADKKKPAVIGTFKLEGTPRDICVTSNYVYVTYEISEQKEDYYKLIESGIKIIDITDKENIVSVGVYDTGEFGVGSICVEGDYLYIFSEGSLKIIDITDRGNPVDKGSYQTFGWPMDFYIDGNYVYLTSDNSLQIIDVTDKENPKMVGGTFASGEITDVFIKEDHAYITYIIRGDESENWQVKESGMQIIDVVDKINPIVLIGTKIPGEAMGIFVSGDYAYVGAGPVGLHIIKLFNG